MLKNVRDRIVFSLFLVTVVGVCAIVSHELILSTNDIVQTQRLLVTPQGKIKKALFSPDDEIKRTIISLIKDTKKHIFFAIFTLTDQDIAQALIEKHREGVAVEVVADHGCYRTEWSKIPLLKRAGIPVYVYPPRNDTDKFRRQPLMHNKFFVFYDTLEKPFVTLTGSFNCTWSASHVNQENILVLDDKEIARSYVNQFTLLKQRSRLITKKNASAQKDSAKDIWSFIEHFFGECFSESVTP